MKFFNSSSFLIHKCFCCCYLSILIFHCFYHWLLFRLIGFVGSGITRFHNSCNTFIAKFLSPIYHQRTNWWQKVYNFNVKVDVFVDVSFRRKLIKQFPKLCINLIIYYFTVIFNIKTTLSEPILDDFWSKTLPGCL